MQQTNISIPLELFDGRFSLEEIAILSIILASPNLSLKTKEYWGNTRICNQITDKLVKDGIIIIFDDDEIRIDLTIKRNMNIDEQLKNIFDKCDLSQEIKSEISDLIEEIGAKSFEIGYEQGCNDTK